MTWQVINADCVEAMQGMDENSVDAIVTDPPYGLEFMGKEWDTFVPPSRRRKEWDGRRRNDDASKWEPSVRDRGDGRPGGPGFSVAAHYKPNTKCLNCGKWQFDKDPCKCADPLYEYRPRQEAPTQLLALQEWHHAWATEALRVLKPGGHLMAFGGTRTYHRLACALEDAGFEIRDCLAWLYGSGFPKSLDVSKAIDKAAGVEREVVGTRNDNGRRVPKHQNTHGAWEGEVDVPVTAPATPDAERWQGWGTALKPAFEPVVLARKPLSERNVAANVLRWGTGALNVDGCRIEFAGEGDEAESKGKNRHADFGSGARENRVYGEDSRDRAEAGNYDAPGRWPANVTLDEDAAAMLDEQTGERGGGGGGGGSWFGGNHPDHPGFNDTGGASRFMYVPKADRAERENGIAQYGDIQQSVPPKLGMDNDPEWESSDGVRRSGFRHATGNHHPTVKPVELMAWLCRMVTPPKGLVLDPFAGSGSTLIAALREGFDCIGIERDPEYVEIARARIQGDAPLLNIPIEVG